MGSVLRNLLQRPRAKCLLLNIIMVLNTMVAGTVWNTASEVELPEGANDKASVQEILDVSTEAALRGWTKSEAK
ncbi:hypothetical protein D3C78_1828060 [compost metagenome]